MSILRRTAALSAAVALCTACASLSSFHSETSIDAGQSFLLGGGQKGAFQAAVKNIGGVPVTLLVETAGTRRQVLELAADSTAYVELQSAEIAVFTNGSSRPALVRVDIRGDSRNLGMRYESARPAR